METANIGLFNDCFPPVMDGVSICVQNYARWMQEKVGNVYVITPNNPGVKYDYPYKVLDYFSVPVPFRKPYVTGIAEIDPFFLAKIVKMRFKIVHAHSPFTSGAAAMHVAKLQNVPIVATFHSKYRDDFARVIPSKVIVNRIVKQIVSFYEKADQVWVPQDSVKEVLREYGFKGHIEVMDNGCDICDNYDENYFSDARKSLGIKEDEFVLLFVGQHIWEKNLRFVIDSLAINKDIPFRMFFVGNGYAAEEMKDIVNKKGLDNKVTFVGSIKDREAIKKYYAAANLFLFPSLYDNAPLVVREAAALHTPSIMIKGATASQILTDDYNGFLVNNDVHAFAQRVAELAGDMQHVKEVGFTASHTIVRSWENVVDEVLDRYNHLIQKRYLIKPLE